MYTVLIDNLIAIPLAFYVTRVFLNLFVYQTKLNVSLVLAAAASTFLIASIIVSYQVMRTALSNPVDSLRYE